MDYLCAKFGDFSHFGFIMWTDRQAESQRQMIAILSLALQVSTGGALNKGA